MLAPTTAALTAALLLSITASAAAAEPEPAHPSSLLSAASLEGGSAALGWAGFSSLGAGYAQGITAQDDLGVSAEFDWNTTELWLAGSWRRHFARASGWDVAGRLEAGWYADFGGTWIRDANRADRGFLVAPAVILSTTAGEGLVSLAGELPLTLTRWHTGGFLLTPKVSASYETPLYGDLTIGVQAALAWRGGGGDAPLRAGRAEPQLLILAGYRLF